MLQQIRRSIQAALPAGLNDDVKTNIDAIVRSNFEKMNLVTREQLEIQEKILERTRERLRLLESRLEILENKRGSSE